MDKVHLFSVGAIDFDKINYVIINRFTTKFCLKNILFHYIPAFVQQASQLLLMGALLLPRKCLFTYPLQSSQHKW